MVVDPVCKMTLEPSAAAAILDYEGERLYFCSSACRTRFAANPAAYRSAVAAPHAIQSPNACRDHAGASFDRFDPRALGAAGGAGVLGAAALLTIYFTLLTLLSGRAVLVEQFSQFWPYIVALAVGFGIQVGLFAYLHRAVHADGSGKVMAVTGTTSGVAMVSCCSHYLVNLLPALGTTGLVSLVGQYQLQLFWLGLAANLAGIVYMGRRLAAFLHGT